MQEAFQENLIVPVRIGLHVGEVVLEGDNVFGDAVNIASRVESMSIPGGVLLSSNVRNQIKNKPEFQLTSLGRFEFKNTEGSMTVYALANEGFPIPKREEIKGKLRTKHPKRTAFQWLLLMMLLAIISFGSVYFFSAKSQPNSDKENANFIAVFPFDVKGSQAIV